MKANLFTTLFLVIIISATIFSQNSYFPLAVGNKWVYQMVDTLFTDTATVTVADSQWVKGKLYYGLKRFSYTYTWLREDSSKVYIVDTSAVRLDTSNIRETLLYDFSANTGESWEVSLSGSSDCSLGGILKLTSKNDSITTPYQFFSECYLVTRTKLPCVDAGRFSEWFAPGIGRVAYYEESISGIRKYYLLSSNIITGIYDYNYNTGVNKYILFQNYPNPFNPTTKIDYLINSGQFVSLKVYNALGQEIAVLANEERPAGKYSLIFNASHLSSGIYFYQLKTNNFISTKKMIILH